VEVSRWRRVAADDDVGLFFRPCRKHSSDLFSDDDDGFPAAEPAPPSALVFLVLASSSTAFLAVQMIALACSSVASTPRPTAADFSATAAASLCMLGFVVMADWLSWSVLASLSSSSSLVLHTIRISERREGIEQAAAREAMGDEEMAGVLLNPALAVSILLLGYTVGGRTCVLLPHTCARAHMASFCGVCVRPM